MSAGGLTAPQCAICLEDFGGGDGDPADAPAVQRAAMPCCARQASTIAYCTPCLRIICDRAPGGAVGQCPTCRAHFSIDGEGAVRTAVRRSPCLICRQERLIVDEECCGPCLLGRRLGPLRYECERCHRLQRIPHPMWRYQESPEAFGTDTWACHAAW